MDSPDPDDYTIGWISALSCEMVAATAFLDEEHGPLEQQDSNDFNTYALGRMGRHNVVIAILPDGIYGTNSAATVAKDLFRTFKNIRLALLVGIAGGAPTKKADIRLGDVVVSKPTDIYNGVIQYDHGKDIQNQSFLCTGSLNKPPMPVLSAIAALKVDHTRKGVKIQQAINHVLDSEPNLKISGYARPDTATDCLYKSDVLHVGSNDSKCADCSQNLKDKIVREARANGNPAIFYGTIASANRLMNNAESRDKLAKENQVLCFEMEAAGLMNSFPCVCIRGICDYSDTHKNDTWQGYAAMTATAYAKELLSKIVPSQVEKEQKLTLAIDQIYSDVRRVEMRLRDDSFLNWLKPPDPVKNYHLALKKRQIGTGQWLLKTLQYQEFMDSNNSMLWLSGLSGCGKTILSATVIEYIEALMSPKQHSNLLMFFFDSNDTLKQSLESALKSLITQIIASDLKTIQIKQSLMEEHQEGSKQPSLKTLRDSFFQMLHAANRTFLVLDALDECSEGDSRYELLEWIRALRQERIKNFGLIVTSRPEQDIVRSLQSHELGCLDISLEARVVSKDIEAYINHRVQIDDRIAQRKFSSELKQMIQSTLSSKANGMFRWVALQIDEIQNCRTQRQVHDALASLPKDLNATYSRMMARIYGRFKPDAIRLLQFLVYSERPLTVNEAIDAIAIEFEPEPQFAADRKYNDSDDLLYLCSSLVTITEDGQSAEEQGDEKQRQLIQLSHFSVREYLTSKEIGSDIAADFTKDTCHTVIGKACMVYLLFFSDIIKEENSKIKDFWQYCARFWSVYARLADADPQMQMLAIEFYLNENRPYEMALQEFRPDERLHNLFTRPSKIRGSALYYASYAGQFNTCKTLIAKGEAVNAQGGIFGSALQAASAEGREKIVQLLIDHKADINAKGGTYGTALQAASAEGREKIVQLLIDRKADINAKGGYHGTALQAASVEGHEKIVQLLIDHKADINAKGETYGTAFQAASAGGHENIVQLLIDHKADLNAKKGIYGTALQAASAGGHEKIVQLLIDYKADLNAKEGIYGTALQAASAGGHEKIVQLLIDHKADINVEGETYGTALQAASVRGHEKIVQLLIDHKADINAKGGAYGTALQAASARGHEKIVQLLIDHKADINAKAGHHGTALRAASAGGYGNIVQLLIDHKADINAKKGIYGTALQVASAEGHENIVELLIDHKADLNAKEVIYGTALHAASIRGHEKIVQLLIDHKADLNAKGGAYGTALQAASAGGQEKIVQLLIDRNADINAEGGGFGTALQVASAEGHENIVQLLLDKGAIPIRDLAGNENTT